MLKITMIIRKKELNQEEQDKSMFEADEDYVNQF